MILETVLLWIANIRRDAVQCLSVIVRREDRCYHCGGLRGRSRIHKSLCEIKAYRIGQRLLRVDLAEIEALMTGGGPVTTPK